MNVAVPSVPRREKSAAGALFTSRPTCSSVGTAYRAVDAMLWWPNATHTFAKRPSSPRPSKNSVEGSGADQLPGEFLRSPCPAGEPKSAGPATTQGRLRFLAHFTTAL